MKAEGASSAHGLEMGADAIKEVSTARKRGRDRFRRYRGFMLSVASLLGTLPVGARLILWRRVERWQSVVGIALRYCLLRTLARDCGDNVLIGPDVEIRGVAGLSVGDNVSIHRWCYIDASGGVSIGSDVSIAHATSILSFEHAWDDTSRPIKDNPVRLSPVTIESDVWIGCGCRILAGVVIHSRSIVAAGAVVTKDVPLGAVVGGVPARVLRSITPREKSV